MANQNEQEVRELPKQPAIFLLQPTYYQEVQTPELLSLWEAAMAARVGDDVAIERLGRKAASTSLCVPEGSELSGNVASDTYNYGCDCDAI